MLLSFLDVFKVTDLLTATVSWLFSPLCSLQNISITFFDNRLV